MPYRIFLGSSSEALRITGALTSLLSREFDVVPWSGDVFKPGSFIIEGLLNAASTSDFAVFVFALDDVLRIRARKLNAVRDNVVFELGLFLSQLGRHRCFYLLPQNAKDFRIPSDLHGIVPITYDSVRAETEPKAAIAAAVADLKEHIRQLVDGDGTTISLSGKWDQKWTVESSRYPPENSALAEVTQIGSHLKAISTIENRPFIVRGQIQRGNVVTGTWFDREQGATYFGAFQLIIDPVPDRMLGKWIGFSKDNTVKQGKWEWTRLHEKR